MLVIKQSLKLLDSLPHSWNKKRMSFSWHSYQVIRAVIIFNTIQMVDKPTFRKFFIMSLFPYIAMFKYISPFRSFLTSTNQDITLSRCPSTFPISIISPQMKLTPAFLAILRCMMFELATIRARIIVSLPTFLLMPNICTSLRANELLPCFRTCYLKRFIADKAIFDTHTNNDTRSCPFCQIEGK